MLLIRGTSLSKFNIDIIKKNFLFVKYESLYSYGAISQDGPKKVRVHSESKSCSLSQDRRRGAPEGVVTGLLPDKSCCPFPHPPPQPTEYTG